MISEECTKLATSLIALRDLARDMRDMLGRLDVPAHYPDIFRVQLDHVHRSGYITDTEYYDLKNLMADVEGHLPAERLAPAVTLAAMEDRMKKLRHSLSDAMKLKDRAEGILFQKVVACECKKREDFFEKCPRCGGTGVWPPGTQQSCDLCGGTGLVPRR